MRESLEAVCGQFEQVILAQMLRTAGLGRRADASEGSGTGDAFEQLFVQALAGALERAGGIGLRHALIRAAAQRGRAPR